MKVDAGGDKYTGLIHSVVVTAANVHDLTPAAELLRGDEEVVYADARLHHRTQIRINSSTIRTDLECPTAKLAEEALQTRRRRYRRMVN